MSKFKILIIEDDKDLNDLLVYRLNLSGYELISLSDFQGVEDLLDNEQIDLLIVDRNLPSGDSLEKIQNLREQGYQEEIIFLTAKALHQDLLEGFKSGCDDYICKPFDFNELLFRIKAILKRRNKEEDN